MKTIHLPPFSTAAFIDELRAAGATLSLQPEGPRVRWNDCPITVAVLEELKSRRGEVVEILEREKRDATPVALGEARALVDRLRLAGHSIALNEDGQTVRVIPRPDEQTVARLKEHKAAIVRLLSSEQP